MPTQFPQITDPVFRQALAIPPVGVAEQIEHVVHATVTRLQRDLANKRNPPVTLKTPVILYDLKGHTAGEAFYRRPNPSHNDPKKREGVNQIRVNNALLYSSNLQSMLEDTIPHEVAHIVCDQIYYGPQYKSHGYEWQMIMLLLGLAPTRCHNYETTSARNKGKLARPYIYRCNSCGHEFHLTQILHRRIQQGRYRVCKQCRTRLVYVETRLDHTTAPQQATQ